MLLKEIFDFPQDDFENETGSWQDRFDNDSYLNLDVQLSDHPKFKYECIDIDSYDGATDASPVNRIVGYGNTPDDARNDWIEQRSAFE